MTHPQRLSYIDTFDLRWKIIEQGWLLCAILSAFYGQRQEWVDLRRSYRGKRHVQDEFSKFPRNRGRLKLMDGTEVML